MLDRQKLLRPKSLRHFHIRGGKGHRLESLSDSIFGLAIAILLLASSVPQNFTELLHFVYDALPLFICMIFIYHIWHQQAVFFLRYGLYDNSTIRLNLILLFLVLFYAYPLKFLMSWLLEFFFLLLKGLLGLENFWNGMKLLTERVHFQDLPLLMVIYSTGFLGIFLIFYLLYKHAYKHRKLLELSDIEVLQTQFDIQDVGVVILVAALSILIALIGVITQFSFASFFAGIVYNLLWMIAIPVAKRREKQLQQILSE